MTLTNNRTEQVALDALNEMESSYRYLTFQRERAACWPDIVQAPIPREPFTADMIYDAVHDIERRQHEAILRHEARSRERQRQRTYTDPYGADYLGSLCYCSPGRGMFFDRYRGGAQAYRDALRMEMMAPNPIFADDSLTLTHMYNRWEPEPEVMLPPPSKELVVIHKQKLDPVEIIPAPNYFRRGVLRLAGLVAIVAGAAAFVPDLISLFH